MGARIDNASTATIPLQPAIVVAVHVIWLSTADSFAHLACRIAEPGAARLRSPIRAQTESCASAVCSFELFSAPVALLLRCCSILDLPDAELILRCPTCSYQMKFTGGDARYEKLSISTKFSTSAGGEDEAPMVAAFTRAKVRERCPACNNPEMSFYTMQMRSVDEGQTVFYECPKCGHTFSTNT